MAQANAQGAAREKYHLIGHYNDPDIPEINTNMVELNLKIKKAGFGAKVNKKAIMKKGKKVGQKITQYCDNFKKEHINCPKMLRTVDIFDQFDNEGRRIYRCESLNPHDANCDNTTKVKQKVHKYIMREVVKEMRTEQQTK